MNQSREDKENLEQITTTKFPLTKTNVISVMPMNEAEAQEKPRKGCNLAHVVKALALYINPAIYVVFSVVYFIIGILY